MLPTIFSCLRFRLTDAVEAESAGICSNARPTHPSRGGSAHRQEIGES
jgi:hypothetical protein